MRFLIRLVVLALAALGAKTLYDILAPRREELTRTGADLVARTKTAAREVAGTASDATTRAASVVHESAVDITDTAVQQVNDVKAAAGEARDEVLDSLRSETAKTAPQAKRSSSQ